MENPVVLNQNTTVGASIACDDIGGIRYQQIKQVYGSAGVAVDAQQPLTDAQLTAQGLATEATLSVIKGLLEGTLKVNVENSTIEVVGTVSVDNFPATQPVSGTVAVSNFPATQPISAASLPLPTGAATEATLDVISGLLSGTLNVSIQNGSIAITAASLPLPANAAQETGGNLAGIKSNTDRIPSLGQDIMAKSTPVAIASDQSAISVNVSTPTTPYNGKVTVTTAATRVQLNANRAVKSVTIKAGLSNSGTIYVGDSSVSSSNGFELAAGDTVSMDISNLNVIYIDASANSQYITYIAVN